MFPNSNLLNISVNSSNIRTHPNHLVADQLQKANDLFREAWVKGYLFRTWSRLTGKTAQLLDLSTVRRVYRPGNCIDCGIRSVLIDQIRGSENRSKDFDARFYPIRSEDRQRWASIANLMLMHISLQAISLIQVGSIYFVRDGHHRVSVARGLGVKYIDAEVIRWKIPEGIQLGEALSAPDLQAERALIPWPGF